MKIKTKLFFMIIPIIMVFVIPSYFIADSLAQELEQEITQRMEDAAQNTMDKISRNKFERVGDITLLSDPQNPILSSSDTTIKEKMDYLRTAVKTYKVYDSFAIYDINGIKIGDTRNLSIGIDASNEPFFKNAINGEIYYDKRPVLPNRLEASSVGQDLPIVHFSGPLSDENGNINGVIVSRFSINKIKHIIQSSSIPDELQIDLLTSDELVIYSNHETKSILQKSPNEELIHQIIMDNPGQVHSATNFDLDNTEILFISVHESGYLDYLGSGWILLFSIPVEVAYGDAIGLRNVALIGGVAIVSIMSILAFSVSINISKPIRALTDRCRMIKEGDLESTIEIGGSDETHELGESMKEMTQALKEKAMLEKKEFESQQKIFLMKEIDAKKDEFLAMVTHELKTPLYPIVGYCKMLKKAGMIGNLNEEQLKAIETIERNTKSLEKLISDILDIGKLEMKKLKFEIEEFSLDEFITNLDSSNKDIIEQKGTELVIDSSNIQGLVIKSDKNRLRQVFDNLINNSSKFINEHGGKIEVGAKKEDQQILFYVRDNGIGIPKNKQKDLFKKFYQIDTSLERMSGGSGLGLAICKAITKKLGGKIWVESQEGKGSTFYFTISSNIVRKR